MQAVTMQSGNTGPIANGAPALAAARQVLMTARTMLENTPGTQANARQLMQVYIQAKHAANSLVVAASDPRTGHAAEYGFASDLAQRAAIAVGQAIVALRTQPPGSSAHLVNGMNRQLHNAAETLGMAYIGAMTGADPATAG